jgi:hypothetical protein
MTLHESFEYPQPKLWPKEESGVKLPQKVGNRPDPDVQWRSATWRWKALKESYKIGSDVVPIGGQGEKL